MFFKQFYLACLAHASYLIGSDGEAAVVDPQRDVDEYLEEAAAHGLKIKYVIETHLHADFVSGHQEIAARTGAQIIFGEKAGVEFDHRAVRDGEEISWARSCCDSSRRRVTHPKESAYSSPTRKLLISLRNY